MSKKDLIEEVRQARLQVEELEKKVQLARGTQRVKRQTAKTVPGLPQLIVKPTRSPYWTGDDGSTRELMQMIETMLKVHPWLLRDIIAATEAGENRVKGAMVRLQREGHGVYDVAPPGTGKALWFLPDPQVLERLVRARRAAARR